MSFDGALLPMDQSGKLNWSAAGLRFEINAGTFGSRRRRSPWRTQIDGIWRAEGGSETERAGEPCEKEKHQKIKKWKRCFAKSGQTRSNPATTSEMNPRSGCRTLSGRDTVLGRLLLRKMKWDSEKRDRCME
jgi:hypothetical protein